MRILGAFAGLTNIGGRGGKGGISRGSLVYSLLEAPQDYQQLLKDRKRYYGFNLIWSDDIYSLQPRVFYVSNCYPEDPGSSSVPRIEVLQQGEGMKYYRPHSPVHEDGVVVGVGNDLLQDEYVKCPYIEKRGKEILQQLSHTTSSTSTTAPGGINETEEERLLEASAQKLRDQLAALFASHTTSCYSTLSLLEKFFLWTKRRRRQPGAATFYCLFALLAVLMTLSFAVMHGGFSIPVVATGLVGAFLLAFMVGFWHHLRMQHLFVDVPIRTWNSDHWMTGFPPPSLCFSVF